MAFLRLRLAGNRPVREVFRLPETHLFFRGALGLPRFDTLTGVETVARSFLGPA